MADKNSYVNRRGRLLAWSPLPTATDGVTTLWATDTSGKIWTAE
jgi:hypothetical protein